MRVQIRSVPESAKAEMLAKGASPLIAQLFAARGLKSQGAGAPALESLLPYRTLKGATDFAKRVARDIAEGRRILVVADYDADGATACAVMYACLTNFGANVGYLIPHRTEHGYGLTPEIVHLAHAQTPCPAVLITVDNGIAAHAGIDEANRLGMQVYVTDHHLPTEVHPAAAVIVNPSQHGCEFPSKALAGCGVAYYAMWALQDELVAQGHLDWKDPAFSVESVLPFVAIGTVADVVRLDENNRTLVAAGLRLIREHRATAGVLALAAISGKRATELSSIDIAFGLGPRLNAAGRLESMNEGVACLLETEEAAAVARARSLDAVNVKRKEVEADIAAEAVRTLLAEVQEQRVAAVLYAPEWHVGVIGIVAGRIKERIWRPTFVLTDTPTGVVKGSGRSIPGLHLRDALDLVDKRAPGVLLKFGGHAMAAGVTVAAGRVPEFSAAFEAVVQELTTPADLQQVLEVDGPLDPELMTLDTIASLQGVPWGQGFPEPLFYDEFQVVKARLIGDGKHLALTLAKDKASFSAVKFRFEDSVPQVGSRVRVAYKLNRNEFRGEASVQLLIDYLEIEEVLGLQSRT